MSHRSDIQYSEKYYDDQYEYRHVVLPSHIAQQLPPGRLLSEAEWRSLGVQQSRGWIHYLIHKPEPHILLFRRALSPELLLQQQQLQQQAQQMELQRQQQMLQLRMQAQLQQQQQQQLNQMGMQQQFQQQAH